MAATIPGHVNLLGQVNVIDRTCAVCGASLAGLSSRARYCGPRCRKRAEVVKRDPEVRRAKDQFRRAAERVLLPPRLCCYCGLNIDHRVFHAKYCDDTCSKRAELIRDRTKRARRTQAWLQSNPAYGKQWRKNNKEKVRHSGRKSYYKHYDKRAANKQWEDAHPGAHVARSMNRQRRLLGNPGYVGVTAQDWSRLILRYQHVCAYCGKQSKGNLEMDHVIPVIRGGRHAIGNVLPACRDCNRSKGTLLLIEWKVRRGAFYGWPRTRTETSTVTC